MKKSIAIVLVVIFMLFCVQGVAFAHSGRTDSSGGHNDNRNASGLGGYHYHHGEGPHLHDGGVCPYDDSGPAAPKPEKTKIPDNNKSFSSAASGSSKSNSSAQKTDNSSANKASGNLKVHYIDVGQADAIFIELPNDKTMLIDAGENDGKAAKYIDKLGYDTIDYVVATHPHADHIGGMAGIVNDFKIGKIYMPNKAHNTATFENLLDTIASKGLKVTEAKAGVNIIDESNLKADILSPSKNYGDNLNNYSAVIQLAYGDDVFLFMGDAEEEVENELLENTVHDFADYSSLVDVLKVGHHGGDTSTTDSFLRWIKPSYAIISVGENNNYGHPSPDVVNRLESTTSSKLASTVYLTSDSGTIIATSDGDGISFDKKPADIQSLITPKPTEQPKEEKSDISSNAYVGSKNSDKYHEPSCQWAKKIKSSNEVWFSSTADAESSGYVACKVCKP